MKKNVVRAALERVDGRPRTAAALKAKFDKTKPKSIYTGSEVEGLIVPRLPSGSFVFDMVTAGGIPKNRITVFHGPKSSSKTTFALRIAGMFQTLHPDQIVAFVDFEGTFDKEWASKYIPDFDRLHVINPDYGEEGVDMIKAYASEAEDVGLIIVDSLAGIEPAQVTEVDAADYLQLGMQVRLINRLLSMLTIRLSQIRKTEGRHLTVLAINQIRANMAKVGLYGSPYSQPGGKKLEHAASMDIQFYTGKYTDVQGVPVKVTHKFLVDKNKVGLPKRTGEITFFLSDVEGHSAGEMDETKVVVAYAKRAGVIRREGNKWILPLKKEEVALSSMLEMMRYLDENPKVFAAVKARTVRECIANPFLSGEEEK